jgi:phage terminase large subunit
LENGISTVSASKTVTVGIEKVQERLKVAADGKPRLFIVSGALYEVDQSLKEEYKPICTEEEFPGYVYPKRKGGRNADENPVKEDDHGLDCVRYMIMHVDGNANTDWSEYQGLGEVEDIKPRWDI